MTGLTYAAVLLLAGACMGLLDARLRLVLWRDPRRCLVVLAAGAALFLVWDVVAIEQGFYHRGDSAAMTGLLLAPELPVEELLFIAFLCYTTLVLHSLVAVAADHLPTPRTSAPRRSGPGTQGRHHPEGAR